MATIKEVYDMATESDNTVVDSADENEKILVSDDSKLALVPKESFNPYLLAPTTSMFGGTSKYSKEQDGYEPEIKKYRRKRKGEVGGTNRDKRDKKEGKQPVAIKEGPKKDSSGNKIFANFWANTPELPITASIAQVKTGQSPEVNLYEAISDILTKHKIEGNPAAEIKDLVQVAVGQICALRSSVHNMEDRMNKMEERMNAQAPAPTFAAIAKSASASKTPLTKQTEEVATPSSAAKTTEINRVHAKAVKPSSLANKPTRLRPRPVLPTVIVRSSSEEIQSAAQLKNKLESTISPSSLGVKIITSRLTTYKGVVLQVQTEDMANKIKDAINQNNVLKEVCNARKPKVRLPQLIIFDIEKREEGITREFEEQALMNKIKASNILPEGETKVLFRKKGRGNREHWIVEVSPNIFAHIKNEKRLQCGFGSLRFKEYIEPMRCFKCHRFGHGKTTCVQEDELCSKCPGIHSHKMCQNTTLCNLGRSQVATLELPELFPNNKPDIYLIQEPYLRKGEIYGLPTSWKFITAPLGKTFIAISNGTIGVHTKHIGQHIAAAELTNNSNDKFTIVSVYFPPSLSKEQAANELEEVMIKVGTNRIVIGGDVNVRSLLWSPEIDDHRTYDEGGPLIDLILKYNLLVLNDPSSLPTFESRQGSSWIDVTLASQHMHDRISNWKVVLSGSSDHNYITFTLASTYVPSSQAISHLSKRKLGKLGDVVKHIFALSEKEICSIKSKTDLENWVNKITEVINNMLLQAQPKQHRSLRVPWWDSELETQRKKTRALRARYNRCRNQTERQTRRTLYKKNETIYKRMLKAKSRACFEKLCMQLTKTNAFSLPYKLATKKTKRQVILHEVIDKNGTRTKSLKETIDTIIQTLFPSENSSNETNEQSKIRENVLNYETDIIDPTRNEIMAVIKQFSRRKAPGLDNTTIEMVEEIHKRCPDLLTTIYNKCLDLGHFPKSWKIAKLVLLNKPGKEPTSPKAYRPICLISNLEKS
ncbi:Retrovirus-related Pol polyprotein from type-1 retrotransposable element R1 [Araneus ventricosus]|uniref:Retrovirus-related Pol polyprotein from type-1 retrotransposable element R1 n=1 Tax=Araneus ventricosus TaxID=182803 RepID=A0A4Y2PZI9_ARAVE|nr:Retrovirus-related Pol polyprotein from type-1 retrotransposable element R1 [Araneus ventricosus]